MSAYPVPTLKSTPGSVPWGRGILVSACSMSSVGVGVWVLTGSAGLLGVRHACCGFRTHLADSVRRRGQRRARPTTKVPLSPLEAAKRTASTHIQVHWVRRAYPPRRRSSPVTQSGKGARSRMVTIPRAPEGGREMPYRGLSPLRSSPRMAPWHPPEASALPSPAHADEPGEGGRSNSFVHLPSAAGHAITPERGLQAWGTASRRKELGPRLVHRGNPQ